MIKKLISIVIPAFNELENLEELYKRLSKVISSIERYNFEVIVVDNGSLDKTWDKLLEINKKDSRFKGIQLSRNFTAPGGITAGFKFVSGDAVIMMCADLQDPPEKIPLFLEKWEEGFEIVYHIVSKREGVSIFRKIASECYHWIMEAMTQGAFPRNASVYRLLDKKAYHAFNSLKETNRYFPGLCSWIGFTSIGIEFPRVERFAGKAKSPFSVVFRLALNGIFSFSYAPLKFISFTGSLVSVLSLAYFVFIVAMFFIEGRKTVPGIATQVALISLFFGVLFLFLGIIGEYLARIYDEVKSRPNFIVRNSLGLQGFLTDAPCFRGKYSEGIIHLDRPLPDNLIRNNKITIELD